MAGILGSALNASANPKQRSEVTFSKFDCLNKKTALILFAVAEAVLGEHFLLKAPKFIETVNKDFLDRNFAIHNPLEDEARGRPDPRIRTDRRRRLIQPERRLANELRIDARFARDLLDVTQCERVARIVLGLLGLLGLLELRRALDYQRDFFLVEAAVPLRAIRHSDVGACAGRYCRSASFCVRGPAECRWSMRGSYGRSAEPV